MAISRVPHKTYEEMEDDYQDSDDDNLITSNVEDGTYIELPESIKKFSWYSLITPGKQESYVYKDAPKIARDILPPVGTVQEKHVLNWMNFLENKMKNVNYNDTHNLLEIMREKFTTTINNWTHAFIIFCANALGMTIHGRTINSWEQYLQWVTERIHSVPDAMMVIKTMCLSFQHLVDFWKKMTHAILIELNYRFPSRDKNLRKTKSFCERMISNRHVAIRRQVNNRTKRTSGYKFRVIKTEGNGGNSTREQNFPQYFFDWMLIYEKPDSIKKLGRPTTTSVPKNRSMGTYVKKQKQLSKQQLLHNLDQQEHQRKLWLQQLEAINDNETNNEPLATISMQQKNNNQLLQTNDESVASSNHGKYVRNTVVNNHTKNNKNINNKKARTTNALTQYSSDDDVVIRDKQPVTPRSHPSRERKQRVQLSCEDDNDYDNSNNIDFNYNSNDVSDTESDDDNNERKPRGRNKNCKFTAVKKQIFDTNKHNNNIDESSSDDSFLEHHRNESNNNKNNTIDRNHATTTITSVMVNVNKHNINNDAVMVNNKNNNNNNDTTNDGKQKQVNDGRNYNNIISHNNNKNNEGNMNKNNNINNDVQMYGNKIDDNTNSKKNSTLTPDNVNRNTVLDFNSRNNNNVNEKLERSSARKRHGNNTSDSGSNSDNKESKTLQFDSSNDDVPLSEMKNKTNPSDDDVSDDDVPLSEMNNKKKPPSSMKQSIININGKLVATKDKVVLHKKPVQRRRKIVKTGLTQTITQVMKKSTSKYKNLITKYETKHQNDYHIPAFDGAPTEENRIPTRELDDNEDEIITEIINVRKGTDYKLEIMVKYNDGQIAWVYVHPAWREFSTFINNFMSSLGITHQICGYKIHPCYRYYRHTTNHDDFVAEQNDVDYKSITRTIHKVLRENVFVNDTKKIKTTLPLQTNHETTTSTTNDDDIADFNTFTTNEPGQTNDFPTLTTDEPEQTMTL